MEAATVKKKDSISKTKMKKIIKNVVCRPDPVNWPSVTEEQGQILLKLLSVNKIQIPTFVKPSWKELKLIPKEERPKPPRIEKVKGLLFGISECSTTVQKGECSAVVIELKVNPPTIVYPIIENCRKNKIPVVCLDGLRIFTSNCFGIPTSCLGIQKEYHNDVTSKVSELYNEILKTKKISVAQNESKETCTTKDTTISEYPCSKEIPMDTQESPYLYRTNKKTRIFVPPSHKELSDTGREFSGQDFINISNKVEKETNSTTLMKMIVKRMSSNANRKKPIK